MESASLFGLFTMGVAYGSTACLVSCSPALMPLLIHRGQSLRGAMGTLGLFGAGRIAAYTLIAALSAVVSIDLSQRTGSEEIARRLAGGVMAVTALWLLYREYRPACGSCHLSENDGTARFGSDAAGVFALGMLLSANLCAPLLSLVAISAATRSAWRGALYGMMFGLGSVTVMLMLYGVIFAPVIRELLYQFRRYAARIRILAALALLLAGVMVGTGRWIL